VAWGSTCVLGIDLYVLLVRVRIVGNIDRRRETHRASTRESERIRRGEYTHGSRKRTGIASRIDLSAVRKSGSQLEIGFRLRPGVGRDRLRTGNRVIPDTGDNVAEAGVVTENTAAAKLNAEPLRGDVGIQYIKVRS
jgi:hypothetical protein